MPTDAKLDDINEIYGRIFGEDPLLLKTDSQEEFGQQILRNLLVERALQSKPPSPVHLYNKRERSRFKKPPQKKPRRPGAALRRLYRKSVATRSGAIKKHFDVLKRYTMVSKGWLTANRTNQTYFSCAAAKVDLESTESPFDKRLRIAAIGFRVAISALQEKGYFDEVLSPRIPKKDKISLTKLPETKSFQKLRRTKLLPRAKYQGWVGAILSHVKEALKNGSHFIVLPEFALPPKRDTRTPLIENEIAKIARGHKHSFFLFSGSRHEGVYNRGFILTREENERRPADKWWHYKLASARSLGENMMGPQNAVSPSYRFRLPPFDGQGESLDLEVVVAICVDVFDTSTFINYFVNATLASANRYRTVILVPSFNPSREFLHALRDLSFLAACPVIYVNGLHGDAELFLYGIAVSDLSEIGSEQPVAETAPEAEESPKVMATLADVRRQIEAKERRHADELHMLQRAILDGEADPKLEQVVTKRRVKLDKRLDRIADQLAAIELLEKDLVELRRKGALKHIITVEHCSRCKQPDHGAVDYCPSDTLYYNLDPLLLRKLHRFRRDYFLKDYFLPRPFQRRELQRVRGRLLEREARG